jgi:phosphohistidine phosphatase SixA
MILLLMRHGIAEDEHPNGGGDAARRLTDKGRARVAAMGQLLRDAGFRPTHYLSSPRIRARQTAEAVAEVFGDHVIQEVEALDFDGSWPALEQTVMELTGHDSNAIALAAGHQPLCGEFLTHAIFGVRVEFDFKKGAIAALEWDGPAGGGDPQLKFYWTWGMVRALKGEQ